MEEAASSACANGVNAPLLSLPPKPKIPTMTPFVVGDASGNLFHIVVGARGSIRSIEISGLDFNGLVQAASRASFASPRIHQISASPASGSAHHQPKT